MGAQDCRHCGKQVDEGELYCAQCQAVFGDRKPRRLWIFSLAFSGLILVLAGLVLWPGGIPLAGLFSGERGDRPVAVVNGEPILQADFEARVQRVQALMERQYGREIFSGERGKSLLSGLKGEVLEEMLEERLIAQEARQLGVGVSGESVEQEIQRIAKEVFGSQENFERRMEEGRIQREEIQARVLNFLLAEEVKKRVSQGQDPQASFTAWLVNARQSARVEISDPLKRLAYGAASPGGCCGGGSGGGCGAGSGGRQADPQVEENARKSALEAFGKKNPAETGVSAKVTDYGCHIQVDILKEGKILQSYSYQDGKVFEDS